MRLPFEKPETSAAEEQIQCAAVTLLLEDGSSSARTSKKLQEARHSNRTLRARFPQPAAVVFSFARSLPSDTPSSCAAADSSLEFVAGVGLGAAGRKAMHALFRLSTLRRGSLRFSHVVVPWRRPYAASAAEAEQVQRELFSFLQSLLWGEEGGALLREGVPVVTWRASEVMEIFAQNSESTSREGSVLEWRLRLSWICSAFSGLTRS